MVHEKDITRMISPIFWGENAGKGQARGAPGSGTETSLNAAAYKAKKNSNREGRPWNEARYKGGTVRMIKSSEEGGERRQVAYRDQQQKTERFATS